MKNKKNYYITIILIIFSLCSCSKNENKNIIKYETIKSKTNDFEKRIRWTNELELSRMVKDYKNINNVNPSIQLTPDVMALINKSKEKNYPKYNNKFSLDITKVSENLKKTIYSFCETFSNNPYSGPEKYFDNNFLFNYIFFLNNFKKFWKIMTGEELKTVTENEKKSDSNKKSEENSEEIEKKLFVNWKIGKPDYSKDLINIPVRFFYNTDYFDVIIEMSSDNMKIMNIYFD